MDITNLVNSLRNDFDDFIELIITGKPSDKISMKQRIHLLRGELYKLEKKLDELEVKNEK